MALPSDNPPATRDTIIRNRVLASGHGGLTLGSEMSGGIENVVAGNIQMNSSELDIVLRFKANTRRGRVMRNYFARNIQVPNGVSANNDSTFNVSTTPDVVQDVDLRTVNATISRI